MESQVTDRSPIESRRADQSPMESQVTGNSSIIPQDDDQLSMDSCVTDQLIYMESQVTDQSSLLSAASPRIHLWVTIGDKDIFPVRTQPQVVFGAPTFVILRSKLVCLHNPCVIKTNIV